MIAKLRSSHVQTAATVVTDCAGSMLSVNASDLGLTAHDNCTGSPTLVCSPSQLSPGTTTVVCTATDEYGNASTFTTSVTLVSSAGTVITNEVVEDAGSANESGNVMRLADGFYIYNLSTASWDSTSGARFRVTMRMQKAGHVDTLCDVDLINK